MVVKYGHQNRERERERESVCDIRRMKTAEMKIMRRTAGHSSLHPRRNDDISEELKVGPV